MLRVYILAGGRSSRFGSDKARATVDEIPLVVRLQQSIARKVNAQIFVIANEVDAYHDLGLATLADDVPHLGPVSGIATALEHFQNTPALVENATTNRSDRRMQIADHIASRWCLILSCDLLEWHNDWLACLTNELAQKQSALDGLSSKAVCFYTDVETSNPLQPTCWNPFPGLYHVDALPIARMICKSSRPSMQALLSDPSMNAIPASAIPLPTIQTANTQEELRNWLQTRSNEATD
ncbi:MAG: molybdenum cofactor guanylyltransferase [Planctomycetota bacterium]|nr:molybdenum cofactor guanylyltransferase [Planctomycetota bacterium]